MVVLVTLGTLQQSVKLSSERFDSAAPPQIIKPAIHPNTVLLSMGENKRDKQLGMPYSTAVYRLQRKLLFQLAQRLGLDMCFRCKQRILRLEEFTVEHKKAWLDVSADLFWDLDNIAFSHFRCNSRIARRTALVRETSRQNGLKRRKQAPEGTAWCAGHKDCVAVENFHNNKRNASGYASYCKDCRQRGYETGVGL